MSQNAQKQAAQFMFEVKLMLTRSEFLQFKMLVSQLKSLKTQRSQQQKRESCMSKNALPENSVVVNEVFERSVMLFASCSHLLMGLKSFIPHALQDDYMKFVENATDVRKKTTDQAVVSHKKSPLQKEEDLTKSSNSSSSNSSSKKADYEPQDGSRVDDIFIEETDDEEEEAKDKEQFLRKENGMLTEQINDDDETDNNKSPRSSSLLLPSCSTPSLLPSLPSCSALSPSPSFDPSSIPSKLWSILFPFQKEGVEHIVKQGGRMLLADEMGLGKTLSAIAVAAYYHQTDWPVLIVCPAGLRKVWAEGFQRWVGGLLVQKRSLFAQLGTSSGLCVIDAESNNRMKSDAKVVIVSYDLLTALPSHIHFGFVICDESHFLKNPSSLRTQRIMPLVHKAKRVLLLSGTPCLANTSELFTQLHALSPLAFAATAATSSMSLSSFFTQRFGDNQNLEELQNVLQPLMLRRLKRDVLSEVLPPKTRKVVLLDKNRTLPCSGIETPLSSSSGSVAKTWESVSRNLASGVEGGSLSGQVLQLYQQAGMTKLKQVCQYMLRLCVDPTNKVLVFGHHKQVLSGVQSCLQQVGIAHIFVDGQITGSDRATLLSRFEAENELRVAVLSLNAVGQGATLTSANHCVFAELSWTPGQLLQAEDRLHRLGQKRPTHVHYLIGCDSLDEALWPLLEKKLAATSKCLDGEINESFTSKQLQIP